MGNNTSYMQNYDITRNFHKQDWIRQDILPKYELWTHRQTLEQVQVYTLAHTPSITDMNIYQWRSKSQYLVRILKVNLDLDESICGQCHPQILIQRIHFRLYNVNYLNIHEAFTILCAILRAYDTIKDFCQTTQPSQELVGFNSDGKPKIWLNKQFNLNTLPTIRDSKYQHQQLNQSNKTSIRSNIKKIYEMVQKRASFKLLPLSIQQKLSKNFRSYRTALFFLQQYSLKNNINLEQKIANNRLINKKDLIIPFNNPNLYKQTSPQTTEPYISQLNLNNTKLFNKDRFTNDFQHRMGMKQPFLSPHHRVLNPRVIWTQHTPFFKINFIQTNNNKRLFSVPNQQITNSQLQLVYKQQGLNLQRNIIEHKFSLIQNQTVKNSSQQNQIQIQKMNLAYIKENKASVINTHINLEQPQQQSPRFHSSDSAAQIMNVDEQKRLTNLFLNSISKQSGSSNGNQETIEISPYFNISPALTSNSQNFHQFLSYKPSQQNISTDKNIPNDHLVTFKKVQFNQDFFQSLVSQQQNLSNKQAKVTPKVQSRLQNATGTNPLQLDKQNLNMRNSQQQNHAVQKQSLRNEQQMQYSKTERQRQYQDDYVNALQTKLQKFMINNKHPTTKKIIQQKFPSNNMHPNRMKSYTINHQSIKSASYTEKPAPKQDLSTKQQQSQNKNTKRQTFNRKYNRIIAINKNKLSADTLEAQKDYENINEFRGISHEQLRCPVWK